MAPFHDDESLALSDFDVWKGLLQDQTSLFERTHTKNAELVTRVEELERELSVWKEAFKTMEADKKALHKTVLKLERSIGALRQDNPLVLCLVDGDGHIFSPELIKKGQAGGREAAMLLTQGLTDHLATLDTPGEPALNRGQVWLTIYCNKAGLLETLTGNNVCTAEEFETFVLGFNQASPLFSIVDVGNGKEAADTKIKEYLRVFTRFPQTTKVFFGGGHDNGYASTVNHLQNEGHLDKLILLRGYKDLAHEINSLNLPQLEIKGVFITKKLHTNNATKKVAAAAAAAALSSGNNETLAAGQPEVEDKSRKPTPVNGSPSKSPAQPPGGKTLSPAKPPGLKFGERALDPTLPLHKQKPPPCNFHYLAKCGNGQNCRYEHHYPLTDAQVAELRINAKRWPCPAINKGNRCTMGDACIMSHFCPKGVKCTFFKQGKCKFIGRNMHGGEVGPMSQGFPTPMFGPTGGSSGLASPASQPMSDHQLSPLASPFSRNGYPLDENAMPYGPFPGRGGPLVLTAEQMAHMYAPR